MSSATQGDPEYQITDPEYQITDPGFHTEDSALEDHSVDFDDLYRRAVQASTEAVARAEDLEANRIRETGARLRVEQDALYDALIRDMPRAVMDAASKGQRVATLLRFDGQEKHDEFCYLYMIKGPMHPDLRREMDQMGAEPLICRLRRTLGSHGFKVMFSWQRETNANAVSVSW